MGTAEGFGVLAASTVTNTGLTVVQGDLGVSPGTAVTGFPPGTVTGTTHLNDGVALQAQADALTAYNTLAGMACGTELTGMDLGGLTLTAGVYCFSSSAQLTGALTLDAQGDPDATFIFQIGSTLTTASDSSVSVINGGSECNVFWQVGSSATLGTGTSFSGDIIALASITVTTGSDVAGRLIALNGAVTLDSNGVSPCLCIPASVIDLGPGCGPDVPTLTVSAPVSGQPLTFTISDTAPNRLVQINVSACGAAPLVVGPCTVYLDLFSTFTPITGMTDANGEFTFSITLPSDPALQGLCLVIQATLWNESTTRIQNLSNGVQLTIGC